MAEENKFHRTLKFPFEIEFPEFPEKVHKPNYTAEQGCFDQKLQEFHNDLGMFVKKTQYFITEPYSEMGIHADTARDQNLTKINFTWGSPDSYFYWWECKENSYGYNKFGIPTNNESNCEIIWNESITEPCLVNVGYFHSIWNPTETPRKTISIFIIDIDKGDGLDFYDALEKYKDYIVEK